MGIRKAALNEVLKTRKITFAPVQVVMVEARLKDKQ
jgi:hypothetical protein